jgi:hypothetical protein
MQETTSQHKDNCHITFLNETNVRVYIITVTINIKIYLFAVNNAIKDI